MRLLLHICCGPCSIFPFQQLQERAIEIVGFYFNPNIHPFTEYRLRKQALLDYAKLKSIQIVCPEYRPEDFFRRIVEKEQPPGRCQICWHYRLEYTAEYAKENGFDAFSTTLLISPYQDHLAIKRIGEDVANRFRIDFLYEDFRTGFRESQASAKQRGLYRQKYCGCIFSEMERYNARA